MADYFTQFSFIIPALTDAERAWITQLEGEQSRLDSEASALDEETYTGFVQFGQDGYVGFEAEIEHDDLWIHDDAGQGETEPAANFVREFLRRYRPDDAIGFEWANTCSKPRTDAFGGGAVYITATDTRWLSTSNWLYDQGTEV